jgi:hypothetical protein
MPPSASAIGNPTALRQDFKRNLGLALVLGAKNTFCGTMLSDGVSKLGTVFKVVL